MTTIEAATAEKAMRQREYDLLLEQAIERLDRAKGKPASTHLGHNLGSLAHELSVSAAKVEAADAMLRFLTEAK